MALRTGSRLTACRLAPGDHVTINIVRYFDTGMTIQYSQDVRKLFNLLQIQSDPDTVNQDNTFIDEVLIGDLVSNEL